MIIYDHFPPYDILSLLSDVVQRKFVSLSYVFRSLCLTKSDYKKFRATYIHQDAATDNN